MAIQLTDKIKNKFVDLACALSPENLSCDGELPFNQVRLKRARLLAEWNALEAKLCREITEDQVWNWSYSKGNSSGTN